MIVNNARNIYSHYYGRIESIFSLKKEDINDFVVFNNTYESYIVLTGINMNLPILTRIINSEELYETFSELNRTRSYLFTYHKGNILVVDDMGRVPDISDESLATMGRMIDYLKKSGGKLFSDGHCKIPLKGLELGTHYDVNLLIGNRIKFDHPLQKTPKSVVDRFGRGSFRGHSSYQILATTWGLLPKENGFPANRQFYLLEDGKIIFYSLNVDSSVKEAYCYHYPNFTKIVYVLNCGLEITRKIFIFAQIEGLPDAVECQKIEITNKTGKTRDLQIVYTGMFGFSNPHCQEEDVLYSTLISQSNVVTDDKNKIVAITPDYYPEYFKKEIRFCSLCSDGEYSDEFETDYQRFIGNGNLYQPANINFLSNCQSFRGPNFFALKKDLLFKDKKEIITFTGMCDLTSLPSEKVYDGFLTQLNRLLDYYTDFYMKRVERNQRIFLKKFASFLQVEKATDSNLKSYLNNNLPFQILYQTFVSRSFAMTQKGYREIGFREIQDLYASMFYIYNCMDNRNFLRDVLGQWLENVYEFGYVNHNFFYQGKEPGMCSDDGLWLVMAVRRYMDISGDDYFLKLRYSICGTDEKRNVFSTIKQILMYSGCISVGNHGLPLLDAADWNDCLRIDPDYLDGPKKEKAYYSQIRKSKQPEGVRFVSDYSESVMNGFLLVCALKDFKYLCSKFGYTEDAIWAENLIKEKTGILQKDAFINGYFARVLINRDNPAHTSYIGSKGDKLSIDPKIDGSYYLNSFSWSLLSGVATESQIKSMLSIVDKYLKTESGYKLCTPHDLSLAGAKNSATDHYFPGDRENGGVFKHATMMFSESLLQSSKWVKDENLKQLLLTDAFNMIDLVLPYKTLKNPGFFKGNPRFCTQYNNSITGENIGPILSGTSSWLGLNIIEAVGLSIDNEKISFNPIMRKKETKINYTLEIGRVTIHLNLTKQKDKMFDVTNSVIKIDGKICDKPVIYRARKRSTHTIEIESL